MEQIAKIRQVFPDGTAEAVFLPREGCAGQCSTCGGCAEKTVTVENTIGAKPGDRVVLEPETKMARRAAVMTYTIPVALLLLCYVFGEHFLAKGHLFGILGLMLGFGLVLFLDRKMSNKYPFTYVITDISKEEPA